MCLCQISEASAYPGLKIIKNHLDVKPGGKTPAQPQKAYVSIVKRPLCAGEGGNYIHKETPPSCASQYSPPPPQSETGGPCPCDSCSRQNCPDEGFQSLFIRDTLYQNTTQNELPTFNYCNFFFFFLNLRWGLWSSSEPGGNDSLRFSDNNRGEKSKFRDRCWLLVWRDHSRSARGGGAA